MPKGKDDSGDKAHDETVGDGNEDGGVGADHDETADDGVAAALFKAHKQTARERELEEDAYEADVERELQRLDATAAAGAGAGAGAAAPEMEPQPTAWPEPFVETDPFAWAGYLQAASGAVVLLSCIVGLALSNYQSGLHLE